MVLESYGFDLRAMVLVCVDRRLGLLAIVSLVCSINFDFFFSFGDFNLAFLVFTFKSMAGQLLSPIKMQMVSN